MGRILTYLAHSFWPMEAMVRGLEQVSKRPVVRRSVAIYNANDYEACEVCVVFGAKDPINRVIVDQRAYGTPVLVVDLGYLKRGNLVEARANPNTVYWSVNLNGLNGWGDPPRSPMPHDRWQALDIELAPWREGGSHILVCGQKPHDAAIDGINPITFLTQTIAQLQQITDRPIRWRPHPNDATNRRVTIDGAEKSVAATLQEDLQDCYAVVAYNSNSLVEALLAGVPVYVLGPGAVAAGMGYTELTEETIDNPLFPDREQFFADLAYRQWTIPEFEQGLPWLHLMEEEPPTLDTVAPPSRTAPLSTPPHESPTKKRRGRPRNKPQAQTPAETTAAPAVNAPQEEAADAFISPESLLKTVHS